MVPKLSLSDLAINNSDTKDKEETKDASNKDIKPIKTENHHEKANKIDKEIKYRLSPCSTHLNVIKEEK